MTEEEKKEAFKQIEEKTKAAHALIQEAEKLADQAGVCFGFSLAYGMGGTYYPKKTAEERKEAKEKDDWYDSDSNEGWQSSSSSC